MEEILDEKMIHLALLEILGTLEVQEIMIEKIPR